MLEAHAHNFLLTGVSPEKLGDPGLGNSLCTTAGDHLVVPSRVLQVCTGVSRALSGLLETTNIQAVGQNPCWPMPQNNPVVSSKEWGPRRKSNPQADLPTLVDIYGPVYTLFTSPIMENILRS